MEGRAHVTVGITCALAILQPNTVPGFLCAAIGGAAGGFICDLDNAPKRASLDYRYEPDAWQLVIFLLIFLAAVLGLDYYSGNGMVDFVLMNWAWPLWAGFAALIILITVGIRTPHRTFMHSIIAGILFSGSLYFCCRPLMYGFAIGFMSHLVLDIFNKEGSQYFWPIPLKFCFHLADADGTMNSVLEGVGTVAAYHLGVYYFITCFVKGPLFPVLNGFFHATIQILGIRVPLFPFYLIAINAVSYVIYFIDFFMGIFSWYERNEEFVMTLLFIFDFLGGSIGKLKFVHKLMQGKLYKSEEEGNFNLYVVPICFIVGWIAFIAAYIAPTFLRTPIHLGAITIFGFPFIYVAATVYLLINLMTYVVFVNTQQYYYQITPRELRNFILSFIGGGSGAYLAMKVTGKHENAVIHTETLGFIIPVNAIVMVGLLALL